jgi:hypothetical protein
MPWHEQFIVYIVSEEVESPPWDGWCPILARGEVLGFWLILVEVLFFNWYTFFCLTRPILPPEMFESGKKIGLDPLLLAGKRET